MARLPQALSFAALALALVVMDDQAVACVQDARPLAAWSDAELKAALKKHAYVVFALAKHVRTSEVEFEPKRYFRGTGFRRLLATKPAEGACAVGFRDGLHYLLFADVKPLEGEGAKPYLTVSLTGPSAAVLKDRTKRPSEKWLTIPTGGYWRLTMWDEAEAVMLKLGPWDPPTIGGTNVAMSSRSAMRGAVVTLAVAVGAVALVFAAAFAFWRWLRRDKRS